MRTVLSLSLALLCGLIALPGAVRADDKDHKDHKGHKEGHKDHKGDHVGKGGHKTHFERCKVGGRDCYRHYWLARRCYVYWWPGATSYYYYTPTGFIAVDPRQPLPPGVTIVAPPMLPGVPPMGGGLPTVPTGDPAAPGPVGGPVPMPPAPPMPPM
ncbi:MAG: hypothetical protein U0793_06935 [Gemmataceae bacterium]